MILYLRTNELMEAKDLNKPTEQGTGLHSETTSELMSQETLENGDEKTAEIDVSEEDILVIDEVDHIQLSNKELVNRLKMVLKDFPIERVKDEVEAIKAAFYKKHLAEIEALKRQFIDSGEPEEDFAPPKDDLEIEIKKLLSDYKERRADFNKRLEEEKDKNYKAKLEVIDGIKDLIIV